MIYSIMKTELDLERLDSKIASCRDPQYLIMNKNTYDVLCKQAGLNVKELKRDAWTYATYKQICIAFCEKFGYGEVEIL